MAKYYMLARTKSDQQQGYYFYSGKLKDISNYLVEQSLACMDTYYDTTDIDEIKDLRDDADGDEELEVDGLIRLSKLSRPQIKSISEYYFYVSDVDITVEIITNDPDEFISCCTKIEPEVVKKCIETSEEGQMISPDVIGKAMEESSSWYQ